MRARHGFTLIEILVTVGLMAVLTAVFMPNLGGIFRFDLEHASRVLAAELQYVGERAVATGSIHRWVLDLGEQVFRVERLHSDPIPPPFELTTTAELLDLSAPIRAHEFRPIDGRAGDWRWLEQGSVNIERVQMGESGSIEGKVAIAFGPDGAADPARLVLQNDGGDELSVVILGFTGEVRVEEPETL
ncbi:MAG: prepilin-type N-terminal cleavage/methylation domain-containing protein [Myxococcota bacterium]